MDDIKDRLRARFANKWGKAAAIILALAVATVIAIRDVVVADWLDKHAVTPFEESGRRFLAQPTGITLALFLGVFVLLVVVALLDTSPNGAILRSLAWWRRERKPKELTAHERYEVDCVREMWLGESQQACELAMNAVEAAQRLLTQRPNYLAGLLQTPIVRLRDAMNALGSSFQNGERRAEIEKRFVEVRAAYGQCACWYNRCLLEDKSLLENDKQTFFKLPQLQQWAGFHGSFATAIETLKKRDGFNSFCDSLAGSLYDMRSFDDPSGFQLVAGLEVKSR